MPFRFVHTGDLHLGSPFKGLAQASEHVAERLRTATIRGFDEVIDLCLAKKVDALLIAGDVYDAADRSLKAQLEFQRKLARLDDHGIRAFICHGNHDPLDGWEARLKLPASTHRFGADVDCVPVFSDRPDDVVVMGVSYPTRRVTENLALRFRKPAGVRFAIGLMHANVSDMPGHENYAPCSVSDLAASGLDYWALGHIHNRVVLRSERPWVVYPGTPQGRNPRETGPRGVNLVTVTDDGEVEIEFHATDVVRWVTIDLEAEALKDEQELVEAVSTRVRDSLKAAGGRSVVYDLTLSGATALHHALTARGVLRDLVNDLNADFGSLDPFAWCGRAVTNTRLLFDRTSRVKGDDFVAVMLRQVNDAKADPTIRATLESVLSSLLTDERLTSQQASADSVVQNFAELLDGAEQICLDELGEVKSK